MRITITAGELIDRGLWLEAFDLVGPAGLSCPVTYLTSETKVTLTLIQSVQIGLIREA